MSAGDGELLHHKTDHERIVQPNNICPDASEMLYDAFISTARCLRLCLFISLTTKSNIYTLILK